MAIAVFSALTRAVLWTTGIVDGFFESLAGRGDAGRGVEEGAGSAPLLFIQLRRAALGRDRDAIAGMLGVPATICTDLSVWYYRFDEWAQQAVAIRFENGRVRGVDLIG